MGPPSSSPDSAMFSSRSFESCCDCCWLRSEPSRAKSAGKSRILIRGGFDPEKARTPQGFAADTLNLSGLNLSLLKLNELARTSDIRCAPVPVLSLLSSSGLTAAEGVRQSVLGNFQTARTTGWGSSSCRQSHLRHGMTGRGRSEPNPHSIDECWAVVRIRCHAGHCIMQSIFNSAARRHPLGESRRCSRPRR